MISVEKAVQIILDSINVLDSVTVPILGARGRILAEDIISTENIPPYDIATISGYALQTADIANTSSNKPVELQLVGEVSPGQKLVEPLNGNQAVRIIAGAALPKNADSVLPEEHAVRQSNKKLLVYKPSNNGDFIRRTGEDIAHGTLVLPKGKKLNASDIGTLSEVDLTEVKCFRQPRVSFLTSGQGISDNSLTTGIGGPSTRYTLYSQLAEYGAEPIDLGIASNDRQDIQTKIIEGLDHDMFVSTVGQSMYDFTHVKKMLEQMGMDIKFWKVAIKPAKPFIFGTCGDIPIFGLMGHPSAFYIVMEEFIRPALMKMMGCQMIKRMEVKAALTKDIRAENGVTCFMRGVVTLTDEGFTVTPELRKPNSVRAFSTANGLIVIPANSGYLSTGTKVTVQVIADPEFNN
jgi:molybdopterin molybdotransferase